MNPTGQSHFNQARIEWAIRLKYSPMPQLDMEILASQLNAFRIGELRVIGKTWEIMYERDAELAVNSDKRKSDAAGLDWQIVSDGSLVGDQHAQALQYFYDNLTATKALDQDSTGGTDRLIYQTLGAHDTYYSVHEMLMRVDNPAGKEVTAEFRETPIWFMESRRGYLGYLQHIFDLYGQPCVNGEWLTAVGHGWLRPLSMIFALKAFALRDWSIFNARYGSGFLDGQTSAAQGTDEWTQAEQAMQALANDGAVLHNDSVIFKFLEQSARNNLPFHPMVEWCNALYAKCYRGVDLATSSRNSQQGQGGQSGGGGKNPTGASVQKEESGIFLLSDSKWVTGVFNERIDRPIIRYLFGQEPRAWFALMPPADDDTEKDLQVVQALVPMGLRIALKEIYKRFRWSVPEANDPCLTPPAQAAPAPNNAGEAELDENGKPITTGAASASTPTPQPKPAPAPALAPEKPKVDDGKTLPAQTTDATPIGVGADPERNPSLQGPAAGADRLTTVELRTAPNPGMPDTQVDAASFWSRSAFIPKGADGQSLPMPSLGYALPNDRLAVLNARGLGHIRAAQALRNFLRTQPPRIHPPSSILDNHASAEPATIIKQIATAHADDLAPIADEFNRIMGISDDALWLKKMKEFVAEHGPLVRLLADVNANPKAAKVLNDFTTAKLAEAIQHKPNLTKA